MRILITGHCGFVGSTLTSQFLKADPALELIGIDDVSRAGSERNRERLADSGIRVIAGDIRDANDVDSLPQADYVIDAAAIPSVLAGVDGKTSSRQLVEHNLSGTINLLEYCKRHGAGFILLSTSRVYSIAPLANLAMQVVDLGFQPTPNQKFPKGISTDGVSEAFSTQPPVSLYGSTKVASEHLALEYGATFGFPVWINRCGVMAGAGQFGHPAQGIFAYWIHSFREGAPLRYIGFGGTGNQVRDCLHPRDLVPLLTKQIKYDLKQPPSTASPDSQICNVSGGKASAISLAQLTRWCAARYPKSLTTQTRQQPEERAASRPFDIPWMVLDYGHATASWDWKPQAVTTKILNEIANFADVQPNWLKSVG